MPDLLNRLSLPKKDWKEVPEDWRVLASSRFFDLLKSEVQAARQGVGVVAAAPDWTTYRDFLSQWEELPEEVLLGSSGSADRDKPSPEPGSDEPPQALGLSFEIMRKAIRCAEVACRNLDELARAISVLDTKDEELRELSLDTWAWSCIRWLADSDPAATEVPVVLCDETDQPVRGYLARFVVEVYSSGAKQLARHPLDTFESPLDARCERALEEAWEGAIDLLGGVALTRGVRWRLLRDGRPVSPTDSSISGAAARAFWFALQNLSPDKKIPDPGVIVLAQTSKAGVGRLDGIGWIGKTGRIGGYVAEKVEAVIEALPGAPVDEQIDTIVVVSQVDHDEAKAKLDAMTAGKSIRVINLAASDSGAREHGRGNQ